MPCSTESRGSGDGYRNFILLGNEYNVRSTELTVQHNGRVAQQNHTAGDVLPDVELPPGGSTTFASVYEIGAEPGELQVLVQPHLLAADTVYYTGRF